MYLGELISALEQCNPDRVLPVGFAHPHSHRGSYEQLAFEMRENVTVGSMLEAARTALGNTYEGYKGGDYTMHEYSEVYLADYGRPGEELSHLLLRFMLAATDAPPELPGRPDDE